MTLLFKLNIILGRQMEPLFLLYLLSLIVVFLASFFKKNLLCSKALGYEIFRNVCIQIFFK